MWHSCDISLYGFQYGVKDIGTSFAVKHLLSISSSKVVQSWT